MKSIATGHRIVLKSNVGFEIQKINIFQAACGWETVEHGMGRKFKEYLSDVGSLYQPCWCRVFWIELHDFLCVMVDSQM